MCIFVGEEFQIPLPPKGRGVARSLTSFRSHSRHICIEKTRKTRTLRLGSEASRDGSGLTISEGDTWKVSPSPHVTSRSVSRERSDVARRFFFLFFRRTTRTPIIFRARAQRERGMTKDSPRGERCVITRRTSERAEEEEAGTECTAIAIEVS